MFLIFNNSLSFDAIPDYTKISTEEPVLLTMFTTDSRS